MTACITVLTNLSDCQCETKSQYIKTRFSAAWWWLAGPWLKQRKISEERFWRKKSFQVLKLGFEPNWRSWVYGASTCIADSLIGIPITPRLYEAAKIGPIFAVWLIFVSIRLTDITLNKIRQRDRKIPISKIGWTAWQNRLDVTKIGSATVCVNEA